MASKNRTMAAKNAKVKKCRIAESMVKNYDSMCLGNSIGVNAEPYHKRYLKSEYCMKINMQMLEDYVCDILDDNNSIDVITLAQSVSEIIELRHKLCM